MKHWFYVVFPYVIPVFAFIFGVLLTVIVALLQLCISNMENTEGAPSKRFFKLHLKGAKFMFGNAVHFRKRDGAVQLHGFSFESTLAFLYILMCECVLAGTTALLTVSILTSRNTLPCYSYSANNKLDCFLANETSTWQAEQHNCTETTDHDATKLICYEIVYNIGAALGLAGGLLTILPLIFSLLTKFIIEYAVAEIHFKCLLIVLQVLLYLTCIGYVVIGFTTDFVKSDSFIDLVGILVLLLCIFCLPWCCMGMDERSYHHDGDREAELDESYEAIQEREPIINVERHQRNINRNRRNPYRNSRPGQERRPDPFDSRRPHPRY